MGLGAGLVMWNASHREEPTYPRCLSGAALGCVIYYVLYFAKSYFYDALLVEGLAPAAALLTLYAKIPASIFNSVIALVAAPLLCVLIRTALKRSHLKLA